MFESYFRGWFNGLWQWTKYCRLGRRSQYCLSFLSLSTLVWMVQCGFSRIGKSESGIDFAEGEEKVFNWVWTQITLFNGLKSISGHIQSLLLIIVP